MTSKTKLLAENIGVEDRMMMKHLRQAPWQRIFVQLSQALRAYGLDLTAPLSLEWYNAVVPPALHLPWFRPDHPPLAIVVGNSRYMWDSFKASLRAQPSTGLGFLNEEAHLCVHPKFGPWFALRAILLFDVEPPKDKPEILLNPASPEDQIRLQEALKTASECVEESWRQWVALRDAIQPNHPMRYSSEQIAYHYTHRKDILVKIVASEDSR